LSNKKVQNIRKRANFFVKLFNPSEHITVEYLLEIKWRSDGNHATSVQLLQGAIEQL
jgi:hypothetical protein